MLQQLSRKPHAGCTALCKIIHIDKYGGASHHFATGMWGAAFQPIAHRSFFLFPIGFEKRAPGSKPPI
jgi:hypothetical protein